MSSQLYQPLSTVDRSPRELARVPAAVSGSHGSDAGDVVQFSEPIAVGLAAEGFVKCDIMRIGPCAGMCSFSWKTVEGSAVAGRQFLADSGRVTMGPNEDSHTIRVTIVNNPEWNATKEFQILLESPEGCTLGRYLKVLRVKVVDANAFPNDSFKDDVKDEEGLERINKFALFAGLIRWMASQPGIKMLTTIQIIIGMLKNFYGYVSLILSVYMVDKVFNFDNEDLLIPGQRLETAYIVALILFVPEVLFFFLDHVKILMDIDGKLESELCRSLFRKFMNYSTESKEEVHLSDMIASLTEDAAEVSRGYFRVVGMIFLAGEIAIAVFFTLQQNPSAWWAVVAVPTIMACWGSSRTKVFIKASELAGEKKGNLVAFVNEALSKMPLISAYKQRPQMNEMFAELETSVGNARVPEKQVILNNTFVPKMMGPALVAAYTMIGASLVINHQLKLGTFLATIKVFGSICSNFAEFYHLAMSIIGKFPALLALSALLNKDTDLMSLKLCSVERSAITKEKRANMPREGQDPRVDRMHIELVDVTFSHREIVKGVGREEIFRQLCFSAPQGSIVVVQAKAGGGRRTLLDLLVGNVYPEKGQGTLFIPSHLRVLLITREIYLLNVSLWKNLTFGNRAGNDPYRIERILEFFKMKAVLNDPSFQKDLQKRKDEMAGGACEEGEAEEEEEEGEKHGALNPLEVMGESDKAQIHLIRGFIMNPEVLVVHRPFVHFHDENVVLTIQDAFKQMRDNRGIEMPNEDVLLRRPRTILMTPDLSRIPDDFVDVCWHLPIVPGGNCVQHCGREMHTCRICGNARASSIAGNARASARISHGEPSSDLLPLAEEPPAQVLERSSPIHLDSKTLLEILEPRIYRLDQNKHQMQGMQPPSNPMQSMSPPTYQMQGKGLVDWSMTGMTQPGFLQPLVGIHGGMPEVYPPAVRSGANADEDRWLL